MAEYIDKILTATGGHAAPVENLGSDEAELPEGYHRMPDGTIMKDSDHENEAALEKDSDDPCWDGYVQVGMKVKDGKEVPNCVPMDASNDYSWGEYVFYGDLQSIADQFNAEVGDSRKTEFSVIASVANRAVRKYSYLSSQEELSNAIRWDVYGFLEYSTLGLTASARFDSQEYSDLLHPGHPHNDDLSSESYAAWVSGAPGLDESAREAVYAAINIDASQVDAIHASNRLRAILASANLPEETTAQIKRALLWSVIN